MMGPSIAKSTRASMGDLAGPPSIVRSAGSLSSMSFMPPMGKAGTSSKKVPEPISALLRKRTARDDASALILRDLPRARRVLERDLGAGLDAREDLRPLEADEPHLHIALLEEP